jgi:regulator of PEP synthase PpsR (kinase-PPPase family)
MPVLDLTKGEVVDDIKPLVFVISDARGETANVVVKAAAAQFGHDSVEIVRLANADTIEKITAFLDQNVQEDRPMAVFHTLAEKNLRRDARREFDKRAIPSIDLLGPAITIMSSLTGEEPSYKVGALRDELAE